MRKKFTPKPGVVYRNEGGGYYECISVSPFTGDARMKNVKSGWTFDAHGIGIYADGTIDWEWSKNGYFAD